ncbi:hypothetical protein ABIB94_008223 [Bradyrhizobium sp. JR7.2]|uniref:Uncharacterized protein n=1 Tax=Bradyrhizobium barranii TaxID=2992140 RepID=A0ABY3R1W1_9BRAD|nr:MULTISPECIES: hypothetical protein [Bradyrhizobium]UFW91853.1 hypothetical protein BjapCC829_46405 [Bradyrhizobium japonicum]WFU00378.1 hypothetical protein QA633_47180 [Bradyrhizobium barranii]
MRLAITAIVLATGAAPAMAQQSSQHNMQNEAGRAGIHFATARAYRKI